MVSAAQVIAINSAYSGGPATCQVTGTTRLYPDLTDATDGATTTQASGSLHVSSTVGAACRLVHLTITVPPGADATLTIADHAGTAYPWGALTIDSTQACPVQFFFGSGTAGPLQEGKDCPNGLSFIIGAGGGAMVANFEWRPYPSLA